MEYIQVDDKLHLERININNATTIFTAINNNRQFLRKWLPFVDYTLSDDDTKSYITSVLKIPSNQRDEVYEIWFYHNFVGLIAFKETDYANLKTEIGYWIIEKMQGKGIVTKSVSTLINFAFRKLKLNRVQIKVAKNNSKSSAIPKRLGFSFEGIEREGEKHQNKFLDIEVYSLLKSDWMKLNK